VIEVAGNQIDDVGTQALAKALESNRSLRTVNLFRACFSAAIMAVLVVVVLVF
jgi:hypothetical protein